MKKTSNCPTLHYTTLHYTTLHYTTLHYTTLHYTVLLSSMKNEITVVFFGFHARFGKN
jgi:hypothetical protein